MKAKLHVSKKREPAASIESARPRYSLPKYGPGDYVRIEIILGGRKQRRSGSVSITATMSIRSSSGLLMMIVLIDLAKRSQQDRSWRRASIEYEKAEQQCVDGAMPSVSRSTQRFSYSPATCTVGCSSPSPAANTDSCIRSTQHLIREITKLLGTIQTLKVDTALLPRTCHICQF